MRICLIVLAVILGTAPAAAQDGSEGAAERTPAGAQRFLSTAAKQNDVLLIPAADLDAVIGWAYRRYDVVPEEDCVSRFEVDPTSGHFGEKNVGAIPLLLGDPANTAKFDQFVKKFGLVVPPYRVRWGSATRIRRSKSCGTNCTADSARFIRLEGLNLWYPDEDMATRAEFAMKFLAEKCRPSQAEGF